MRQWLLANAFLLAIVLIAAGVLFALMDLVRALKLSDEAEHYAMPAAGLAALVAAYFFGKWLHAFIGKRLRRRA